MRNGTDSQKDPERPPLVLVADDNSDAVRVLSANLARSGYSVATAEAGVEAVEKTRLLQPLLVVLDIMMPEMNGFEALRLLQTDPSTWNIPVIILTSRGADDDITRGFELGATDYMTKPFSVSELVLRIKSALDHQRD